MVTPRVGLGRPKGHPKGGSKGDPKSLRIAGPTALFCFLLCLVFMTPPVSAENRTTLELELYNSVNRLDRKEWTHSGAGLATLRFDQMENRNVRSQFEISALISPSITTEGTTSVSAILDVGTAYAKFRFSSLRGIVGKAPFSWGEGLIFNVADEIFGSSITTNLMQSSFDDSTAWITGITYYTGPFSFVEFLVNPGPSVLTDPSTGSPGALEETRLGGRFVAKPFGLKLEGGYLFDGRDGTASSAALREGDWYHRPYLSLQGNLVVDWHLSASLELPDGESRPENRWSAIHEGMLYTAGLYSVIPVGYDDTFSFRAESRLYPAGLWKEDHAAENPRYGLYGYGECSWDFGGGLNILLRGLVNPIDLSARITPGVSWNIFQGFTLLSFLTVQTGEVGDSYPREAGEGSKPASPGFSFLMGCSVTY